MIPNSAVIHPIVLELHQNKEFEFHLTGSRFFQHKPINSWTDYDFFVQDSPTVEKFLKSIGFKLTHVHSYADSMTKNVYRWHDNIVHANVDVQIVSNVRIKSSAQIIIHANQLLDGVTNDQAERIIWETNYNLAYMLT